jgi:HEAT repeat protein
VSEKPTRREVALAGHVGDVDGARAALSAADPAVRAIALGALERLEALDDGELAAALTDESPVVRHRAATLAARHPGVDLLPALHDGDPGIVEVAAWACGEHQSVGDDVLQRLLDLAGAADDPLVRESAVAALGAIGDDRGLDAILAATRHKPAVRRRAVLALAPFLDPDHRRAAEVAAALRRALADRDWQVRQAAEDLLPRD